MILFVAHRFSAIPGKTAFHLSILSLFFALLAAASQIPHRPILLNNAYINNSFTTLIKILIVVFTTLFIIRLAGKIYHGIMTCVFFADLLLCVTGVMMAAGSLNLIMLYLSLELSIIPAILIVKKCFSPRAGAKLLRPIVQLQILGSGISTFGISLIFSNTGDITFSAILAFLQMHPSTDQPLLFLGFALMVIGFMVKWGSVPFHGWLTDLLSVVPRLFFLFIFIILSFDFVIITARLYCKIFWYIRSPIIPVIAVFSAVAMTFTHITALYDINTKKKWILLLIAQQSYFLLGIVSVHRLQPLYGLPGGLSATLFHLITLLMSVLGLLFIIPLSPSPSTTPVASSKWLTFSNFSRYIFVCSIAGIPLTMGFVSKFFLIAAVVTDQIYWLAIIGALNAVLSMMVSFSLINDMHTSSTDPSASTDRLPNRFHAAISLICAGAILYLGLFPEPLRGFVQTAARAIW